MHPFVFFTPISNNKTKRANNGNADAFCHPCNLQARFSNANKSNPSSQLKESIQMPFLPPMNFEESNHHKTTVDIPVNATIESECWICKCGLQWSGKRKRCSCSKWRGGKRGQIQKRQTKEEIEIEKKAKEDSQSNTGLPAYNIQISPSGAMDNLTTISGISLLTDENSSLGSIHTDDATTDSLVQRLLAMDLNGDGGNSDEDGDGFFDANGFADEASESNIDCELNGCADIEWNILDNDDCRMFLAQVFYMKNKSNEFPKNNKCNIKNAPDGWFPPRPPDDWEEKSKVDTNRGEPIFATNDNPGGWSPFTFRAKFSLTIRNGNISITICLQVLCRFQGMNQLGSDWTVGLSFSIMDGLIQIQQHKTPVILPHVTIFFPMAGTVSWMATFLRRWD